MAVAGFARYMDHIGASKALVKLTITPLLALKAPYLVMAGRLDSGYVPWTCNQ